jgi:hypothetical protein
MATNRSPAAAIAACVRTLNVFALLMVVVPVAVLLKVTLLKVTPFPLNVVLAPEQVIVDVPALSVKFEPEKPTGVVPLQLIADDPNVIERVKLPVDASELSEQAKLPVLKSPRTTLIEFPTAEVNALPKVQPPPAPFKTMLVLLNVTLLVVIVLPVVVAKKLTTEPAVVVNTTPVAAFVQLL